MIENMMMVPVFVIPRRAMRRTPFPREIGMIAFIGPILSAAKPVMIRPTTEEALRIAICKRLDINRVFRIKSRSSTYGIKRSIRIDFMENREYLEIEDYAGRLSACCLRLC